MTKTDKRDVEVPCFGNMRGCRVYHCNVAGHCYEETLFREEDHSIGPTDANENHRGFKYYNFLQSMGFMGSTPVL